MWIPPDGSTAMPTFKINDRPVRTDVPDDTPLLWVLREELGLPLAGPDLVLAPAHRDYNHADYRLQTTGGSCSIRAEFVVISRAGASVRELFRAAAARRCWIGTSRSPRRRSWNVRGRCSCKGTRRTGLAAGLDVHWQKIRTPGTVATWRSVGHSHDAFFIECFADELAHSQREDPLEFR